MITRLTLQGTIEDAQGIHPTKNGFKQIVVLKQVHDQNEKRDQYYTISIWSNAQTDSRFKSPGDRNKPAKCVCYFKGDRWPRNDSHGYYYNNKLELIEWV